MHCKRKGTRCSPISPTCRSVLFSTPPLALAGGTPAPPLRHLGDCEDVSFTCPNYFNAEASCNSTSREPHATGLQVQLLAESRLVLNGQIECAKYEQRQGKNIKKEVRTGLAFPSREKLCGLEDLQPCSRRPLYTLQWLTEQEVGYHKQACGYVRRKTNRGHQE